MCKNFFFTFLHPYKFNFKIIGQEIGQILLFRQKCEFFFSIFLRKINLFRNLKKYYFKILNFNLKNKLQFKIKLTKKIKKF